MNTGQNTIQLSPSEIASCREYCLKQKDIAKAKSRGLDLDLVFLIGDAASRLVRPHNDPYSTNLVILAASIIKECDPTAEEWIHLALHAAEHVIDAAEFQKLRMEYIKCFNGYNEALTWTNQSQGVSLHPSQASALYSLGLNPESAREWMEATRLLAMTKKGYLQDFHVELVQYAVLNKMRMKDIRRWIHYTRQPIELLKKYLDEGTPLEWAIDAEKQPEG